MLSVKKMIENVGRKALVWLNGKLEGFVGGFVGNKIDAGRTISSLKPSFPEFLKSYFITMVVCKSVSQLNPTTHILDHIYPELYVRL